MNVSAVILLMMPVVAATALGGCRRQEPASSALSCPKGMEYYIHASETAPGRRMVQVLKNCSKSKTWWVNRRLSVGVYPDSEEREVRLRIVDSEGREARPGCVMEAAMPEESDYRVLSPGESVEAEWDMFSCADTRPGTWYRVQAIYRDKNPQPPRAPANAIHFTDEIASNTYEETDLDYERWELAKGAKPEERLGSKKRRNK